MDRSSKSRDGSWKRRQEVVRETARVTNEKIIKSSTSCDCFFNEGISMEINRHLMWLRSVGWGHSRKAMWRGKEKTNVCVYSYLLYNLGNETWFVFIWYWSIIGDNFICIGRAIRVITSGCVICWTAVPLPIRRTLWLCWSSRTLSITWRPLIRWWRWPIRKVFQEFTSMIDE